MKWNVAAPFFDSADGCWIDDFVPGDRHRFHKVASAASGAHSAWHGRAGRGTPVPDWVSHWHTAGTALAGADGVVTVFPPLATAVAVRRRVTRRSATPIVAWCFNIGRLSGGAKRVAARLALRDVERFIVHSTAEVRIVATYLGVPESRIRFVPLQRRAIPIEVAEEERAPFLLAMGSANRDYATLMAAARQTGLPLVVVAAPRAVAGLDVPANVTLRAGLTAHECRLLAQRARASVVPLADVGAASGQVTVIEAQRMRRPVIATRSIGTVDYIEDDRTGLLVEQGSADALAGAMLRLWNDPAQRTRLAEGGASFAAHRLSDEAAGRALGRILDEVAAERA